MLFFLAFGLSLIIWDPHDAAWLAIDAYLCSSIALNTIQRKKSILHALIYINLHATHQMPSITEGTPITMGGSSRRKSFSEIN
ncbi:hypothetical protein DFH27DRAFT_585417 [Peziza echinospora]|nr:hypothetical protein DFH27DRAFT_585417 [Peziza echinospora]